MGTIRFIITIPINTTRIRAGTIHRGPIGAATRIGRIPPTGEHTPPVLTLIHMKRSSGTKVRTDGDFKRVKVFPRIRLICMEHTYGDRREKGKKA